MHRLVLAIFLTLSSFCLSESSPTPKGLRLDCPDRIEAKECVCLPAFGNVFLECSGLRSLKQLKNAFRSMKGFALTELRIRNSTFTYIPYDLFRDSSVSRIRITNSTMLYLFNRDLIGVEGSLTDIVLEDVDFDGGFDWDVLENLSSFRTLSIQRCDLQTVGYEVSQLKLPLETLLLPGNDIEMVDDEAFRQFTQLTNLKLSSNEIVEVKRSMFPQPTCGLQFLDLSFNKLTSFPEDMFDGMLQFHSLILRGNKFTTLGHISIQTMFPSLAFFDVSDNPILCDCKLSWLLAKDKPFHFFGQCSNFKDSKNLKDLAESDFEGCG